MKITKTDLTNLIRDELEKMGGFTQENRNKLIEKLKEQKSNLTPLEKLHMGRQKNTETGINFPPSRSTKYCI